jgi:mRNA interferase RelE/StbE
MKYRIEIRPSVLKELARIPQADRARIRTAIDAPADEPRPSGCVPIKAAARGSYRIRVGRYRVVYLVRDDMVQVMVMRIAKRDENTYQRLAKETKR